MRSAQSFGRSGLFSAPEPAQILIGRGTTQARQVDHLLPADHADGRVEPGGIGQRFARGRGSEAQNQALRVQGAHLPRRFHHLLHRNRYAFVLGDQTHQHRLVLQCAGHPPVQRTLHAHRHTR